MALIASALAAVLSISASMAQDDVRATCRVAELTSLDIAREITVYHESSVRIHSLSGSSMYGTCASKVAEVEWPYFRLEYGRRVNVDGGEARYIQPEEFEGASRPSDTNEEPVWSFRSDVLRVRKAPRGYALVHSRERGVEEVVLTSASPIVDIGMRLSPDTALAELYVVSKADADKFFILKAGIIM